MIRNFFSIITIIQNVMKMCVVMIYLTPLYAYTGTKNSLSCPLAMGAVPKITASVARDLDKVEHIFILMQENHSFDQYLGQLTRNDYYGNQVDGLRPDLISDIDYQKIYINHNFDGLKAWYESTSRNATGNFNGPYHNTDTCPADPDHEWNAAHISFNNGLNNGFIRANSVATLGYYGPETLPFIYAVANEFSVGDRYFSSMLGPTIPNRTFLYAGTSAGLIINNIGLTIGFNANSSVQQPKLIWELLNENNISWGYYVDSKFGQFNGYTSMYKGNIVTRGLRPSSNEIGKIADLTKLRADLKSGNLPKIIFIDGMNPDENEHPSGSGFQTSDIREGQHWLETQVRTIVESSAWDKSALFITYDENGGFADHVVPPKACQPDQVMTPATPKNMRAQDVYNASFDQYGFRVPFIMISPFAKRHYVSHTIYDHTSILKFIETRYKLPALTARDANANDMLDLFDFSSAPNTTFLIDKPSMLTFLPGENGTTKCLAVPLKYIH